MNLETFGILKWENRFLKKINKKLPNQEKTTRVYINILANYNACKKTVKNY